MTLRQLQYLLAVVDHDLRITAAASTLNVSQPNISKSIKALEEELQLRLFKRKGKRLLHVTEAGVRVLNHARAIQVATIELEREASRLVSSEANVVTVVASKAYIRHVLPLLAANLTDTNPDVQLRMLERNGAELQRSVVQGEADFVLESAIGSAFAPLLEIPCFTWNWRVVVGPNHPLTRLGRDFGLRDLSGYGLLCFRIAGGTRSIISKVFLDNRLPAPDFTLVSSCPETLQAYAQNRLGVALLPDFIDMAPATSLSIVPSDKRLFPPVTVRVACTKMTLDRPTGSLFAKLVSSKQRDESSSDS